MNKSTKKPTKKSSAYQKGYTAGLKSGAEMAENRYEFFRKQIDNLEQANSNLDKQLTDKIQRIQASCNTLAIVSANLMR